ncbi:sensor histidine kinase [Embleya hyalina]|uniref:sensor histidine kinase n=1 Tax=Embleya hyalina TaxID=516124 RepID=UPI000F821554|nr:histidine kinase [Embleya hyalina]
MQRIYAWLRAHPLWVDSVCAFPAFGLGVLQILSYEYGIVMSLWAYTIVVALSLGMALHRVRSRVATMLVVGSGVAQLLCDGTITFANYAMLVIAYTAAKSGPRWLSRAALASTVLAPAALLVRFPHGDGETFRANLSASGFVIVLLAISWVLGDSMRTRRAFYAELIDRAARLEVERDQQARLAAAAERARIARELHDVVAHNVSVMVVQADGAAYAIDAAPDSAREALGTIAATGREALAEMRRLLGVLRSESDAETFVPQPGVDQLDELLTRVRGAGLAVDLHVEGRPVELSQGIGLTVYRIVQEALTNTRKHGGPGVGARVVLRYTGEDIELDVRDDGRGEAAPGDGMGHGLVGMSERVALFGGRLETGPYPAGGWRVHALLPTRPRTPALPGRP